MALFAQDAQAKADKLHDCIVLLFNRLEQIMIVVFDTDYDIGARIIYEDEHSSKGALEFTRSGLCDLPDHAKCLFLLNDLKTGQSAHNIMQYGGNGLSLACAKVGGVGLLEGDGYLIISSFIESEDVVEN